jgi:hypothetical protein
MKLVEIFRGCVPTRTKSALKAEIAHQRAEIDRLRAENRALLNSILGIAGIPPISVGLPGRRLVEPGSSATFFTAPSPAAGHSGSPTLSSGGDESLSTPTSSSPHAAAPSDPSSRQSGTRNDSHLSPSSPSARLAAPIRRRSWHQINRMLEIESARKPVSGE